MNNFSNKKILNLFISYGIIDGAEMIELNEMDEMEERNDENKGKNPYDDFIKYSAAYSRKSFFPLKSNKKMTIFEMNEILKIKTTFFQGTRENWNHYIKEKIDLNIRKKVIN